eukprot:TRINITY_DN56451_c0_g1_i1.p1 TRINITY_DN56451_c0_g1~~TRINITY_DN56451_c0_g1_i1.p1  ORF type:complete len:321 (-),score=58.52 TRINITY_DN56451_c0_g1_i1:32-994(-)
MEMKQQLAGRLVVVTGGARGVGLGICRQVLAQDPSCEVIVLARSPEKAAEAATALGPRAHSVACDVTCDASCVAAAKAVSEIRRGRAMSLVNNAGLGLDLPWFPTPWPPTAAAQTIDVNLRGAQRVTHAFMSQLLDSSDSEGRPAGRVVFVSSGAASMNMKRMADGRRAALLSDAVRWTDIELMAEEFQCEYEAAANAAIAAADEEASGKDKSPQLPFLSATGWWLQSYGFSKACLGAYCRILAKAHLGELLSVACTPGFVATDMTATYAGEAELRNLEEGGDVPAWLACGGSGGDGATHGIESGCFYGADRSRGAWVAE